MKALTSIIIATTVLLTLTAACSHKPMEPSSTMKSEHHMEPMKGSGSMDGSMDKNHGSMMKDKPMMEKPADSL